MRRKHIVVILLFSAGIYACNKDVAGVLFQGFRQPENFPAPVYRFETNKVTEAGFELGRTLFYDPVLSYNNTISCGSCHIQTSAFTHHGHSVSHGIYDRLGTRNTPAIMNLAWSTSFMWDGGVFDLDLQPIAPITNHVEMDDTVAHILQKLSNTSKYPPLFQKAFGTPDITSANFLKALSQFMVMCVSDNAKYDSVKRSQASFTADEQAGYIIFQKNCNSCHKEPLFTDYSFRNNGINASSVNDLGRYDVTLQEKDKYTFKVPSLRNLDFTPPYMHDGRFLTLDAVLDHYINGVQNTQNLDPLLKKNASLGIPVTQEEKTQLLAFLKTLNDRSFLLDKRFSEQ